MSKPNPIRAVTISSTGHNRHHQPIAFAIDPKTGESFVTAPEIQTRYGFGVGDVVYGYTRPQTSRSEGMPDGQLALVVDCKRAGEGPFEELHARVAAAIKTMQFASEDLVAGRTNAAAAQIDLSIRTLKGGEE